LAYKKVAEDPRLMLGEHCK